MQPNRFAFPLVLLLAVAPHAISQPTLQFAATSYSVAESAGTVTLNVQRLGDSAPVVGVDFTTVDGTATNGIKYTAASGTLTFEAGVTNLPITVTILNNGLVEVTKSFRVVLSNATGGAVPGSGARTNVTVSINDNDVGMQIRFPTYSVAEDAGAVVISLTRGDDGTSPMTVDYTTANSTAISGADYIGVTNTLGFAAQERDKLVAIPILNDNLKEANKTFRVTLLNAVGGSLGTYRTTTVTILDNDLGFQFETNSYACYEDAGAARIGVRRGTDDTNSAVTVDLATTNLTATHGLDYLGVTNTLAFAPGEVLKFVDIPVLNDGLPEPSKTFRGTLSNPTGNAVLGTPATATVTLRDNDPGVGFELGSYAVWENEPSLTVNVLRGNDAALGPITVDYATSNLTAVAGADYQSASGKLAFGENETVKAITIPILRNPLVTNNTSFRVLLSNPTGGATLGTATATVNILNAPELGVFRAIAPPFDTALNIRQTGGVNFLTWAGGGQLQRADHPTGPWQTLASATSPLPVRSPLPVTFYRVARPRPVNLFVPSRHDGQTNLPLVILLHGYARTGQIEEDYMQLRPLAEARGFLYCYPDGTRNSVGVQFFSATDFCCDITSTGVDDAGYLRAVIEEIALRFAVDRKRIYLVGHSNGGFLCYRMACQFADTIAGIASLAGTTFLDPGRCAPSQPVNILHIHGTADEDIRYWGWGNHGNSYEQNMPAYPGALTTIQFWAGYNGSSAPVTEDAPTLNLSLDVPGLETVITRYTNAPPGGAVELWTMVGGNHIPTLYSGSTASEFAPRVIDWLLAHPKP